MDKRTMWGFIIIGLILGGAVYPPIIQIAAGIVGALLIIIMLANIFIPAKYFWPKDFRERMEQRKKDSSNK